MNNKRFKIITVLLSVLLFTGCTGKENNVEMGPKSISDLMENYDKVSSQSANENETSEKKSEKVEKNTDSKTQAKKNWEKSLAKEKKLEKIEADKEEVIEEENKKETGRKENGEKKESKKKLFNFDKEDESYSKKARIKFFGDTMAHYDQVSYAYNYGGGTYDFSKQYEYIKDYVKDADLSITNYETTTNPNRDYSGFPAFNTPGEYLKDIKDAGFDVVTTANNHTLDTGEEGVFTTIDAIKEAGLDSVGTHETDDQRILYKEVNGIKIAILSYTYGCNGEVDLLTPREEVESVNYIHDDLIKDDIKTAKKNGADFVIVYPHWEIEYESYPIKETVERGHKMIDWGADLVIGNHPHVVQPVEKYSTEDGREGLIAYALGNLVSLQSYDSFGDYRVEQGLSIDLNLELDEKTGNKKISNINYNPLWIGMRYDEFGETAQIYKCEDFLEGGDKYDWVDEYQRERIRLAYNMTMETVETEVGQ